MDFKSKFSELPTVDISVVKLKGRKVTKSILNQIEVTKSYRPDSEFFNNAKILGYVNSNEQFPWMLIEKDGRLLKSSLQLLLDIIRAKTVSDVYNFVDIEIGEDVDMDDHFSKLPEDVYNEFQQLQDQANYQLTVLKNHQIYI